ncbi:MAG: Rrf2 family transcriptional regulator [Pseudomonadota bacterium]
MQLTRFSDIGMRVLIYLSCGDRAELATIPEIASRFGVSRHHMVKVVHFMAQQNWIVTSRGKGGGMTLANPVGSYRIGDLIRNLEGHADLIDCSNPPCHLRGNCHLKGMLDHALKAFFECLNTYTLADAVASPTGDAIIVLHQLGFQKSDPAMHKPL